MPPRRARLLWIAAIIALALGLVGAFGAAVYLSTDSLEEWTAKLMPPGGKLLHAETRERHHFILYQTPESRLMAANVHPPHPLARQRYWSALLTLGKPRMDNVVPPGMYPFDGTMREVDRISFPVPADFAGELHLLSTEFLHPYVGALDTKVAEYDCVVRWP